MHWSPVVPGTIDLTIGGKRYIDYNDTLYEIPAGYSVSRSANTCEQSVNVDVVVTDATGAVVDITTLTPLSGAKVVYSTNANDKSEIGISGLTASTAYTLKYSYNNQYIPQNDLPLLNAEMAGIAVTAKMRRIAIYFSQLAQFQANQDYGFDLAASLSTQAVSRLSYKYFVA